MTRLADYFFVIGVEDKTELYDGKELRGCVFQKFPEVDWKDTPCPQGLEHFCQPAGWYATGRFKQPSFFISILTDMEGRPSYLACLSFQESVQVEAPVYINSDTLDDAASETKLPTSLNVPKCICIVSRQRYYATLKNCLLTIFASYIKGEVGKIEKMVGCMLGFVHVPPAGGPKLTFSIGGGDSQVLQPPLSDDLPSTKESVAVLFNQLGIHSMLLVFTALVTECKILLLSSSYTHLGLAAEALIALLYPLKFSYVFIPILPSSLLDFLTAPTPFLMGVNIEYEKQIPEMFDVVVVNIDEGYVTVPESVNIATIPQPYYNQVLKSLKMILTPSLFTSDLLCPIPDTMQTLELQDKQLRAVFIKLFAELFSGYRSCLTLIRVHPQPVISFNKLAFMERRSFVGDEFLGKVLESVSFSTMTQARGPPYREIDMFDELVASVVPSTEEKSAEDLLAELIPIVDHLCENEPWYDNPEVSTVPSLSQEDVKPPFRLFPLLSEIQINGFLTESTEKQHKSFKVPEKELREVPKSAYDLPVQHFINQRRLEVIKDCIQYIYENKTSDARKAMPSVLRALKGKGAQYALCNELESRLRNEKSALLNHEQYNLIVRLINAALQDDNTVNSTVIAAKIVPLVSAFQRKLGASAIQFAYTSVQDHQIWSNIRFWEESFYMEVQKQIVELHVNERERKSRAQSKPEKMTNGVVPSLNKVNASKTLSLDSDSVIGKSDKNLTVVQNESTGKRNSFLVPAPSTTPQTRARSMTNKINNSPSADEKDAEEERRSPVKEMPDAMKLAADLLCEWDKKTEEEKERLIYAEESIVYSLTMLFAQRMMYLRVPENACVEMRRIQMARNQEMERRRLQMNANDNSQTNSATTTDDNMSLSAKPSNSVVIDSQSTRYAESIAEYTDGGSMVDFDARDLGESPKDTTAKFILRFVERVCIEAGVTPQHLKSLQTNIPMLVGMHIELLEEVHRELKDAPTQKAKIMRPSFLPGEKLQYDILRCYLLPDGRELGVRLDHNSRPQYKLNEDERDISISAANGGPCLLPAEGALFLTNYRIIFKGTPDDQFASEMTVTRSFPIGALMKEKRINDSTIQVRSTSLQMMKIMFDEEVMIDSIENLRKTFVKLRWPPSVYNTFAFNFKAPPVLQRTLSQRQQSIKKTHVSLSNVVSLSKRTGSVSKRNMKVALSDDATTRQYKAVKKDSAEFTEDDSDMRQVMFESENRGADRLRESALCRDYERLGLGGITKVSTTAAWRISMANFHYSVCRSYPAVVVIPRNIADDTILKVAKNHRLNRFPVAVWRHKRTKGTLLRSGAVNKNVLQAILKASLGSDEMHNTVSGHITEDEKLFNEIVKATHLYSYRGKTMTITDGAAASLNATTSDFSTMFEGSTDNLKKAAEEHEDVTHWEPANLYIFTDKAGARGSRMESSNKVVVVNTEIPDLSQVKISFSKLLKVCCPSDPTQEKNFLLLVEESKWLNQVSLLLQISCSIVNLIDIQGSSCLVSYGDGSETTTQIISLVQVLSDPFYRTIEGFKVLVEKDWLAFGYRFSHRGNHTQQMQPSIAPFFLQFLDCVYQVMLQYPHAFEFNNYFLKFIAYHQTSMRFNTFFLDSEHERYQHGWFPESDSAKKDKSSSFTYKTSAFKSNFGKQKKDASLKSEQLEQQQREQQAKKSMSVSLWDYLQTQTLKFTIFHSFSFHPNLQKGVLQPFCNVSNLELWDYYTHENLYTGPTYDLELISDFDMANPSSETSLSSDTGTSQDIEREDTQRCLTGCYGSTLDFPRDEASYLLNELSRLDEELECKNIKTWRQTWDDINIKKLLKTQTKSMYWDEYWAKARRIAMHKRATLDMVLKGKVTESTPIRNEFGFEHPHNFVYHNYILAARCNYCVENISGIHSGLQCTQCGYNVHEKCKSLVPPQCPKHPSLVDQSANDITRSIHSLHGGEKTNPRNFKGTLYKRGSNFRRQWKSRWFVLDTERHLLTYYMSEENPQLLGHINLEEMRGCRITAAPPGAPKIGDARAFFELETTKRTYFLHALSVDAAQEWVERLNALNV